MPAKSKAQQRFMGMVHAVQKGDMEAPSKEVEKAADSMSDADAKDYASTKHKGLPNHVKKENMESELKEIIRQTYRESLRESINESTLNEIEYKDALEKFNADLYKNSQVAAIAKHHNRPIKDVVKGLQPYIKVLRYNDKSIKLISIDFRETNSNVKVHVSQTYKQNESVNEAVSHEAMGIASMTNTRKEAVQKFIDDNNLDGQEILKTVTKGGLVERVRFIQALVGTPNNSSFKWYVRTFAKV